MQEIAHQTGRLSRHFLVIPDPSGGFCLIRNFQLVGISNFFFYYYSELHPFDMTRNEHKNSAWQLQILLSKKMFQQQTANLTSRSQKKEKRH